MERINEVKIPCDRCGSSIPFRDFNAHKLLHESEDNQKLMEVKNVDLQAQLEEAQKQIETLTTNQVQIEDDYKQKFEAMNSEKGKIEEDYKQKIEAVNKEKDDLAEDYKKKMDEAKQNIKDLQDQAKKNNVQYPAWWDLNALSTLKYGEEKFIDLDINTNQIAKEVVTSFNKTAGNQVTKIEGVMNQMLYDKWWNERQLMINIIGKDKLNERQMFHGTKSADVMKFVVREGFRAEFNTAFASGQGTYFAKNASYSCGYAATDNGVKKMFRCAVICGESIAGSSNYTLKTWPKKPNGLIYDSLVAGSVADPSVVVIHENARIYPMFIIHFT